MRATVRVAGLTLAATVLVSLPGAGTSPAVAAETCQGQAATIVDLGGGWVEGTEGDDVIVAAGAVRARGGDDLICVSGSLQAGTDEPPDIDGGAGFDSVRVRGSQDGDEVDLVDAEGLDVRLRGGFDVVRVYGTFGTGTIHGGSGADGLVALGFDKVVVDLEDEVLKLDGGAGRYTVSGFKNVRASGSTVKLTGDAAANKLSAVACSTRLAGGRGSDVLEADYVRAALPCALRGARILGLRGNDRMYGTKGNDVLVGGPGRDSAVALGGVDRCTAEKKRGCER